MATVTGMTAAAMQAIRDGTVVSAAINGSGHLILTKHDGTTVDAGVAVGPAGAAGAAGATGPAGPSTLASGTQITWGADVNLYRSAADVLKTDDAFVAALGYSLGAPLAAPAYQAQQIAAQTVLRNKLLAADANDAFHVLGSGKLEWGAGGATAIDTNLYRSAADVLKTDDAFISVLGISVPALVGTPAYATAQVAAQTVLRNKLLTADANDSFHILGDGKQEWGAGGASATDTTLYRSNPSVLKTDGYLRLGQNIVTNVGAAAQVSAGDVGPSNQAGFALGSSGDTNLYRSAADTLKTDDDLLVGANIQLKASDGTIYSPYWNRPGGSEYIGWGSGLAYLIGSNFRIDTAGKSILFGSAGDTNLYRSAADTLKTDDSLVVGGSLTVTGSFSPNSVAIPAIVGTPAYAANQIAAQTALRNKLLAADANDSFHILGDGKIEWGAGGATAVDTNLYRTAAGTLKTDSYLFTALDVYVRTGTASQVKIGAVGSSSEPGVLFGSAGDTILYRSAADTLKTDDSLVVGGTITLPTNNHVLSDVNGTYAKFSKGLIIDGGNFIVGNGTVGGALYFGGGTSSFQVSNATPSLVSLVGGSLSVAAIAGSPAYAANQVAAQTLIRNKLLAADANDSFHILGDGKHEWGAGGATAVDTNLYRSAADTLKTDDNFITAANLTSLGALSISGGGATVVGNVNAGSGQAYRTQIGTAGPSSEPGLIFGLAGDTNLYRSAADMLKTDDSMTVGTKLIVGSTDSPGSRTALFQIQQTKTNTTPITGFGVKTNEAFASNPQTFDLMYFGAAAMANREYRFQTGESGVADGGIIGFNTSAGDVKFASSTGKIGFYGAAPVAQQTGVAVTAAAIHAALVALGLITA